MLPPADAVLLPLAWAAPGTPVRLLENAPRHAEPLALLGLVPTAEAALWAVAWRWLDGPDDPNVSQLRDALVPGGWAVVAVETDAPPEVLTERMEAAGLALATAPVQSIDADGARIVHGVYRRVDPGMMG